MIQGIKEDNTCFIIPHIQSELEGMFPWNVTVFEIIAWILCISSTMATLLYTIPVSYYVAFYFTFRLAYDFGLGILLDRQSKYKSFARFIKKHTQKGDDNEYSSFSLFLFHLMRKGSFEGYNHDIYPNSYNSWLVFKHLENLILWMDGYSFGLLCLRCANWDRYLHYFPQLFPSSLKYEQSPHSPLYLEIFWDIFDAHEVVGAYAWFWGDFFFKSKAELTFDGIYNIIPHPMYTIGYTAYYGLSVISRSYTVFICSIIGHSLQLFFLFFIEQPHMDRIYGNKEKEKKRKHLRKVFGREIMKEVEEEEENRGRLVEENETNNDNNNFSSSQSPPPIIIPSHINKKKITIKKKIKEYSYLRMPLLFLCSIIRPSCACCCHDITILLDKEKREREKNEKKEEANGKKMEEMEQKIEEIEEKVNKKEVRNKEKKRKVETEKKKEEKQQRKVKLFKCIQCKCVYVISYYSSSSHSSSAHSSSISSSDSSFSSSTLPSDVLSSDSHSVSSSSLSFSSFDIELVECNCELPLFIKIFKFILLFLFKLKNFNKKEEVNEIMNEEILVDRNNNNNTNTSNNNNNDRIKIISPPSIISHTFLSLLLSFFSYFYVQLLPQNQTLIIIESVTLIFLLLFKYGYNYYILKKQSKYIEEVKRERENEVKRIRLKKEEEIRKNNIEKEKKDLRNKEKYEERNFDNEEEEKEIIIKDNNNNSSISFTSSSISTCSSSTSSFSSSSSSSLSSLPFSLSLLLPPSSTSLYKQNKENISNYINYQKIYNIIQQLFYDIYINIIITLIRVYIKENNNNNSIRELELRGGIIIIGVFLVFLSLISFMSCINHEGLFGYYYGNHFILPLSSSLSSYSLYSSSTSFSSSYTLSSSDMLKIIKDKIIDYINHPFSHLPYLHILGIALILNNKLLLLLYIIITIISFIFDILISIENMNGDCEREEIERRDGILVGLKEMWERNKKGKNKVKEMNN